MDIQKTEITPERSPVESADEIDESVGNGSRIRSALLSRYGSQYHLQTNVLQKRLSFTRTVSLFHSPLYLTPSPLVHMRSHF